MADELWGVAVVGASAAWRGSKNDFGSSRAPSGSVYGHVAYLVGAFAPSVGLTLTGFAGKDHDKLQEQAMPLTIVSPSMSLEWSSDWIAVLANLTTPYEIRRPQLDGEEPQPDGELDVHAGHGVHPVLMPS